MLNQEAALISGASGKDVLFQVNIYRGGLL